MPERTNPVYKARLQKNPLADTPLFEATEEHKADAHDRSCKSAMPPKTIRHSKARMEAFDRLLPNIEHRQQQVLAVIKAQGPITTAKIAGVLDKQVHLVSGRVTELRDMGYIEECGQEVNPATNRKNSLWKAI
jgi:predicted transcriptional regulator